MKGPVDSFKGFQQEPEEPFRLREKSDPETGRSVDPAEVGGLHHLDASVHPKKSMSMSRTFSIGVVVNNSLSL
jgi:hypothetical protein